MAELDVQLSWRWMYWFYVPIALLGMALVWRYFRPDRPPRPMHLPIDWLAVTLFVAWVVAVVFAFSWYRKWGGWTSNAFAVTVDPLRRPARGPGGLARVGLQPRRAPEAAAANPRLHPVP